MKSSSNRRGFELHTFFRLFLEDMSLYSTIQKVISELALLDREVEQASSPAVSELLFGLLKPSQANSENTSMSKQPETGKITESKMSEFPDLQEGTKSQTSKIKAKRRLKRDSKLDAALDKNIRAPSMSQRTPLADISTRSQGGQSKTPKDKRKTEGKTLIAPKYT